MTDSDRDDVELLEYNRGNRARDTCRKTKCRSHLPMLIMVVVSCSLLIQIAEVGIGLYIYNNKVDQLVKRTHVVLDDWEDAYNQLNPYLGDLGVLFNVTNSITDLVTVSKELAAVWPELYRSLRGFNNFTHNTEQFIGWTEKCVQSYGFCQGS